MDALLQGYPGAVSGFLAGMLLIALPLTLLWFLRRRRQQQRAPAELALAQATRRNERIVEASGEGLLELDNDGRVRFANPAAAALLGRLPEALVGLDYRTLVQGPDEHRPRGVARYTTDVRRGVGAVLKLPDGRNRPVEYRTVPLFEQGESVGTVLAFSDMTERVRLDALLHDTQATARVGGWEIDLDSSKIRCTEEMYRIYDLPLGSRLNLDTTLALNNTDPADHALLEGTVREAIEQGREFDIELRQITPLGRRFWARVIGRVERREGRSVRLFGTTQDITDRKLAAEALLATRDFYHRALDALPVGISYVDRDRKAVFRNRLVNEWFAIPADIATAPMDQVLAAESYSPVAQIVERALLGETCSIEFQGPVNGRTREWRVQHIPDFDADGNVAGFFAVVDDITETKRLEEHLLRAQKMQAIGELTGGIAHDFNNLLGIILGNLQLMERSVSHDPQLTRKVRTAMRAGLRGADLTRRLLAFARRQILDPVVLDLRHLLQGLAELMQRTLGESVETEMKLAADLWHVRVDPGQLENAILNLAINASDAMPVGGRLVVAAKNRVVAADDSAEYPHLAAGDYVAISVSDTGCGIPAEVLKRVFEPFFTTKPHGKGTGLGLPMVHGFAEQSGGIATIDSEVGRGTTVTLLLPRSREDELPAHEDTIVHGVMPEGMETILVVEDNADLRETVVTALRQLGYQTLEAADASAALALLGSDTRIDLLFTDIMMPGGMLGPVLAKQARQHRPGLGVLFTTGFAERTVLASGDGVAASDVLGKPYRNEELALKVRQAIDRGAQVA